MTRIAAAAFAWLISLGTMAQIPGTDLKGAVKAGADTAIDQGQGAANTKADQARSTAETKTDSAKAAVDAKAAGVPVAGEAVQGATTAGSAKAKSRAKKAHGNTLKKTDKTSSKAHKKVDDLAK
jgi:hypothetical protein